MIAKQVEVHHIVHKMICGRLKEIREERRETMAAGDLSVIREIAAMVAATQDEFILGALQIIAA